MAKKVFGKWSSEDLDRAISAIRNGSMGLSESSRINRVLFFIKVSVLLYFDIKLILCFMLYIFQLEIHCNNFYKILQYELALTLKYNRPTIVGD